MEEYDMFEGLFQPMHLLLIFAVVLVVFGPKNLPGIGKGLGESIREFKKAFSGEDEGFAKILINQQDRKKIESTAKIPPTTSDEP
jgi:sec-independent protein translocase protein TatA